MTSGLQVISDTGLYQISADTVNLCFLASGTIQPNEFGPSNPSYVGNPRTWAATVIPAVPTTPVVFLATEDHLVGAYVANRNNGQFVVRVGASTVQHPVHWYMFGPPVSPAAVGLNLYTASGALAYCSDYRPALVVGRVSVNPVNYITPPAGKQYAFLNLARYHSVYIDTWSPQHGSLTGAVYTNCWGGGYNGAPINAGSLVFDGWTKSVTGGGKEGSFWQSYGDSSLPGLVIDVTGL